MAYFHRGLFPSLLERGIGANLACPSCDRYKKVFILNCERNIVDNSVFRELKCPSDNTIGS